MNTVETTPSVTPPANPAKGNQRGQTTLAAEIDRWQAMVDNLVPQVDQMPGLKETFVQFQAMLATAKSLRNQLNMLRAETSIALTRRNQLLGDGGDLFARLQLGLQAIHGPRNPRLREFGLKPRGVRPGRPRKTAIPPPVAITTAPHPSPAVPAVPVAKASPGE